MKKIITLLVVISISLAASAEYIVGEGARDFSLKNVDGKMISMKRMKDKKGFIIIFTCNHCPFAKAYEQRIIDLDKKYGPKGYQVIAINPNDEKIVPDDSYENMIKNAKEKGFKFPYLLDETQEIAASYGATRTPHVFVLERVTENLIVRYVGAIDNNSEEADKADQKYVENAVDALLAGKKVELTNTKAIGCTIKWKQPEK